MDAVAEEARRKQVIARQTIMARLEREVAEARQRE
jgi:hypothetical protein